MPFDSEEQQFFDALFRQRRKHGVYRLVDAPHMESAIADTHCHPHLLPNPALAFARCAVNGVSFLCNVVDVVEDDPATLENVDAWLEDAKQVLKEIAPADEGAGAGASAQVAPNLSAQVTPELATQVATQPTPELATQASAQPAPQLPHVCFAVGCHPHNAKDFNDVAAQRLREILNNPRVRAIGEIGLDFHYDFSPRPVQENVFRQQLRLAHELNFPVVLHIREAHTQALHILKEEGFPAAGTLLHCFNLGQKELEPWLEYDCYIGLGGPVTFKKSSEVREAVKMVPLNRLVTETDAPYMTPEPMRGITCLPDHVIFTADKLAQVRGCITAQDRRTFFEALYDNARTFYGYE